MRKYVMRVLYTVTQCTWGILQTFIGFINFLMNIDAPHFWYHGAVITKWKNKSSVSLGMFVFVTDEPFFCEKLPEYSREELSSRLLVHEYGHTIQSLIFGPFYLFLIGIPSTLWGFLPSLNKKRQEQQISYFSFFTEDLANKLGEWVTKEKSMEKFVID